MNAITRRTALTLVGGSAVAVGLAACAPTNGQAGGGVTPSTDASGRTTLALADVPVGGAVSATVGNQPVLVAQPTAGTVVAFSAICTHQGCVVAPANDEFDCPCHGSRFALATGAVLQGPAEQPLDKVDASVDGDSIVLG